MSIVRSIAVETDFNLIDDAIDNGELPSPSNYDCEDYWREYRRDYWIEATEPIVDRVTLPETTEDILSEIVDHFSRLSEKPIQWYRYHSKNKTP